MSAINNNNSGAMRVFANPLVKFNEQVMSFMDIDDLEWMRLVSKQIPQQAIDHIMRDRVLKALLSDNKIDRQRPKIVIQELGKDALNGITIRNFRSEIRPPLSNLPMGHMAGFEQIKPGTFTPYIFSRHGQYLEARCSCLSNWIGFRYSTLSAEPTKENFSVVEYLNVHNRGPDGVLSAREDSDCCDFPSYYSNSKWNAFKRCCGPIVFKTCLCCCYKEELQSTPTWEQVVRANTPNKVDAQGPKRQEMN